MSPQKKRFSYEIQIQLENKTEPDYIFKNLNIVPQVHYLRDGHYEVDFGNQKLYISKVRAIVMVRHEEVVNEIPEVKLDKKEIK